MCKTPSESRAFRLRGVGKKEEAAVYTAEDGSPSYVCLFRL